MRKIFLIFLVITLGVATSLMARAPEGYQPSPLAKANINQVTRTICSIANWTYWQYSSGLSAHTPADQSGGIYPKGKAGVIYTDGLVWGGHYDGNPNDIRVGGVTYNVGTVAGWIDENGNPADPNNERVKIWRIRDDWQTLTYDQVRNDAMILNQLGGIGEVTDAMCQDIIDQYEEDWKNWPTDLGAPFYDVNNNGVYEPDLDGDGTKWEEGEDDRPGVASADQVIWYVANDLDKTATTALYGSDPIGIELQVTMWAYAQPDARLGQIVFKKYKFINRSGVDLTNTYVSQWSDPDIGTYTNDFVGCDTTLSLGFAYNGEDTDADFAALGMAPAAVGYDFFQGPIVESPGDTAVFNFEKRVGYKNLPMSSFGWFAAGSAITDPELGQYVGTLQFYNLMRGFVPTDDIDDPVPWTIGNKDGNPTTKYPLAGDPITEPESDRIDGNGEYFSPGDRRMCLSTGPFTFAAGDTQEVVVAVIGGSSTSRLKSLGEVKTTDQVAQTVYDNAFKGIPSAPAAPKPTFKTFEDEVVIEWGSDKSAVEATEEQSIAGYEFEGYNVYQLPSSSAGKDEAVKIATFDKINGVKTIMGKKFLPQFGGEGTVPVQNGLDKGVQRYIHITKDHLTGNPLYEGKTYYFAVTAYNYKEDPELIANKALETALVPTPVRVEEPAPGDSMAAEATELIPVEHSAGPSDGIAEVQVINPAALTGHEYKIFFELDEDTNSATYGEYLYSVKDMETGEVVASDVPQASSIDAGSDAPIIDGVQVKVSGPPEGINNVFETDADGNVVDDNVSTLYAPSLGSTGYIVTSSSSYFIDRFGLMGMDDFTLDFSEQSVAWNYYGLEGPTCLDEKVPFSMYRYDFSEDETERMFIAIYDSRFDSQPGTFDTTGTGPYGNPAYDPIYGYISSSGPYDPADESEYLSVNNLNEPPSNTGWGDDGNPTTYPILNYIRIEDYLGNGLPIGNKIKIVTNKPNTAADEFTFSTKAPTLDDKALAKKQVEKINVFPNPYYAHNPSATDRFDNYVTFTHLPQKAEIRIFNLKGVMVKKLEKDNTKQFQQWDLTNESDLPVASGIYIAHVELPDLDETKVLKIAIVQKKQILEYF
jgi:hypothetical protein